MKRTDLIRLHELTEAVAKTKEAASDLFKTAQDRFNTREHDVKRVDGTTIRLAEKVMWEEVFYIGKAGESGKALREIHPEVFEAYDLADRAADELKKFCVLQLDVDYTQMTLSSYLKLTEALFDLMLEERHILQGVEVSASDDGSITRLGYQEYKIPQEETPVSE